jgi:hypothetical protein
VGRLNCGVGSNAGTRAEVVSPHAEVDIAEVDALMSYKQR